MEKKGSGASRSSRPAGLASRPGSLGRNLKFLFTIILILAALIAVAAAGFWVYQKRTALLPPQGQSLSIKFPAQEKTSSKPAAAIAGVAALSAEEKEILYKEVIPSAERVPDAAGQEILNRVVRLETGWVEKLPSGGWTLEQYTQMLDEQERFYKISFPRSYKKKLQELFRAKYLAGVDAFTKGDLLAARNLWVESLAFPLYSEDLPKHRAVALTMLRPFINDTLAKVRAMNQSLVDKGSRAREEALSVEYQKLSGLIAQKQWTEALAALASLAPQVAQLQKSAPGGEMPPPYPPSFGNVDADIQRALMDLMATNPSSLADLQPLQQDLTEKRKVLETFTEEYAKKAAADYRHALTLIHDQNWGEAIRALESVTGPRDVREDAARKISLLKKISGSAPVPKK